MKIQTSCSFRMPAEWAPHEATWLNWPHDDRSWPGYLDPIPYVYADIVRVLTTDGDEHVHVVCKDEPLLDKAARMCEDHGANMSRCTFHILPTDWTWFRDTMPTAVHDERGSLHWISWRFNGWAKYEDHTLDLEVPSAVGRWTNKPVLEARRPDRPDLALIMEGGAIEINNDGLLLTTAECLLSDNIQVRNEGMTREAYEGAFRSYVGARDILWLPHGCAGDVPHGTHGHIDDVARFVNVNTVLLAFEEREGDDNHPYSVANWNYLIDARRSGWCGLEVIKLPFPSAVCIQKLRLPASYANFYIANGAVLVPTFSDAADAEAVSILKDCFPERTVIGIPCRDLVFGYGAIHCLLQQQPESLQPA